MKYSQLVQPKKLAVRRDTAAAMIENAKLFDRWIDEGLVRAIDPNDAVPLYDVGEIENAYLRYRASKVGK